MFPLLETLVAVYEVGQFTLAADELKVSQSTVSSRIAQLEQMVGAPLFVRNAKSDVTPTQAGRMLYQTAIGIDGLWRARARFRCAVLHGFVFQDHAGFAASHHGGVQQCRDCGGVVFRLWAVADFGSRSAFWSAGAKARRRIRAPFLCLGAEIRPDARSARAGGSDYRCVARIVSALSPVRGEPECGIGKIDDMYWLQ